MINFSKNNIIINSGCNLAISKIIDSYEITGKNQIFLHRENSDLKSLIKVNKIIYSNDNISEKILTNLFRVDMIYIEDPPLLCLNEIRKLTNLPIILILSSDKSYNIIVNSIDIQRAYNFEFLEEGSQGPLFHNYFHNYIIKDLINNWESNLESIQKDWVRREKIKMLSK
jgi:hypothetical protein